MVARNPPALAAPAMDARYWARWQFAESVREALVRPRRWRRGKCYLLSLQRADAACDLRSEEFGSLLRLALGWFRVPEFLVKLAELIDGFSS